VPFVNTLLTFGCILTVVLFGSSSRLASAYGIAVTGTMAITTAAFFIVARRNWHWPLWFAPALRPVPLIDAGLLLLANAHKLADGGWFPLAIGAASSPSCTRGRPAATEIFPARLRQQRHRGRAQNHRAQQARHARSGAAVFMVGSPRARPSPSCTT
jgi:KUP system potassium uptake protein